MANANGWGDGASNNDIGWGKGADNAIGWGSVYSVSSAGLTDIIGTPAVDPDAQAFITAASITDPTQQAAINQLVVDLKGYNIWTKMKALYPFVGGTAAQHKWNLKDPRDLDAAFRLTFFGGLTHNSQGVTGNGSNGYFNTHILLGTDILKDNNASGVYVRTNIALDQSDYGVFPPDNQGHQMSIGGASNIIFTRNSSGTGGSIANLDTRGFFQMTRRNSSNYVLSKGLTKNTLSISSSVLALQVYKSFGLALNFVNGGGANFYSSKNIAFHYYANSSLSDTELDNLYTAVQAFQTTLGRSIGTQTVSDADAQAFVTNAGIVDQVEANAVNNLVIGLKADGLWTKMKAVYPMVGGSSSTMKYNLKNPLDTDAAFRLTFVGGLTHSNNGMTIGINGYANSHLIPSTSLQADNAHHSVYLRNSLAISHNAAYGCETSTTNRMSLYPYSFNIGWINDIYDNSQSRLTSNSGPSTGLIVGTRAASNSHKLFRNSTQLASTTNATNGTRTTIKYYIGAYNVSGSDQFHDNGQQIAFYSIGDGLSDTDATNLNTRVTTFQTALNRNV